MPLDLWSAFKEQAGLEGLLTLGATGALFAVARPQDKRVQAAVTGRPPISPGLAHVGTWAGNGAVLFPVMGAVYGIGWGAKSDPAWEAGAIGLEALALAGIEVQSLKYATQRKRPDDADRLSFPSGHAAEAFAVATTLASQFGWPAGVPGYLAAGFVGTTRLQYNKHWLSDVVAGAGLGILCGRAVFRAHRKDGRLALRPWLAPGRSGVLASMRF